MDNKKSEIEVTLKLDTKEAEESLTRIKKLLEDIKISAQEVKSLFKLI